MILTAIVKHIDILFGYSTLGLIFNFIRSETLSRAQKSYRSLLLALAAYFFATVRYGHIVPRLYTLFGIGSAPKVTWNGFVKPGYERVLEQFLKNFNEGMEVSAQCAAYVRGEQVINVYGHVTNNPYPSQQRPYNQDNVQVVFSAGKSVESVALAILVDRGLISYSDKISKYWPEFAQNGKEDITIADLMRHEAGLSTIEGAVTVEQTKRENIKQNSLGEILARQKPYWPGDVRRQYHGATRGWVVSEIVRRVDAQKRTLGEFVADEIARPLGADFYFGTPEDVAKERWRKLEKTPTAWTFLQSLVPLEFGRRIAPSFSIMMKVVRNIKKNLENVQNRQTLAADFFADDAKFIAGESPSINGVTNALALAKIASAMAQRGRFGDVRLISEDAWAQMHANPIVAPDGVMMGLTSKFTQGGVNFFTPDQFINILPQIRNNYGNYGWMGAGGSIMQWHPEQEIGFGYAMTLMDGDMSNLRGITLNKILYECAVADNSKKDSRK